MAQLQNELAERELLKKFRHDNSWLSVIRSKPEWVSNDVIKIPRRGVAPNVLINNGIYPILSNRREDDYITLSLNKYDTENTDVTEDELYALPYEKLSDVQVQHRETLEDVTARHALFSLAAPSHTAITPILECTGEPDELGRRRLTSADLIQLWKTLGKLDVPLAGRGLKLSVDHAADLMYEDSTRAKTWGSDWSQGLVPVNHAGFALWVSSYGPRYSQVNGVWTRQAFDSLSGNEASVLFHTGTAVKAPGTVKRFALPAEMNPTYRKHTIGFQLYFVAVATQDEGSGGLISPIV